MPDKKVPTSRAGTSASAAKHRDYTATLSVDQSPDVAYAAILNVRGWWSGDIEGRTDQVGEEWTYRYEDIHYSKQRVTELVPGKKVVWLVLDSRLSFVKDQSEWNGTRVVFDVARKGAKTEVTFTHVGLEPGAGVLQRLLGRMGLVHSGQPPEPHRHREGRAEREEVTRPCPARSARRAAASAVPQPPGPAGRARSGTRPPGTGATRGAAAQGRICASRTADRIASRRAIAE